MDDEQVEKLEALGPKQCFDKCKKPAEAGKAGVIMGMVPTEEYTFEGCPEGERAQLYRAKDDQDYLEERLKTFLIVLQFCNVLGETSYTFRVLIAQRNITRTYHFVTTANTDANK